MLTAVTTGIADADGLVNATYSWVANDGTTDTDISGATDATYTLVADDAGKTIKVRVIVTDDLGNETTLTSTATDEVGFAVQQQGASNTPTTGEPTISGTAQVGQTLIVNITGIADADGLTTSTYSYQWLGDDTDISGATDATYTLVAADEGRTIKVRVSFADDAGNETTLTSAATEAVAAAPQPDSPATGEPTISGTAQVGQTLIVNITGIADADGLTTSTYSYQWLGDDTDISGATDATYTLVADDEGRTIKVRVSVADDRGERDNADQRRHGGGGGSAPARQSGHRGANHQRHGPGGPDPHREHHGHRRRGRSDHLHLQLPVAVRRRRNRRGHRLNLHPGGRRRGPDHQGEGHRHRRSWERDNADQRRHGGGGGSAPARQSGHRGANHQRRHGEPGGRRR